MGKKSVLRHWRERQGFRGILLSFFCIFVFPCLLLIAFVQKVYIGQINSYVTEIAVDRQKRVVSEMDLLLENVELLANSIFLDTDFRKNYEPSRLSEAQAMMSKLNILALNQKYITNILIYNSESKYLFSPNSSYDRGIFCNIYHFEGMDNEGFFEYLDTKCDGTLRAERNGEPYLVFCRSRKNYVDCISVIIMVKQRAIDRVLEEELADGCGMTAVLNADGQTLFELNNDEAYEEANYRNIIVKALKNADGDSDSVQEIVSWRGKKYVVTMSKSQASGLSFVSVITDDSLLQQVEHWQNLWTLLIVVTGLTGIVVIRYISWMIYRPVEKLRTRAEEINGTSQNGSGNDYESIGRAMAYLSENNLYLKNQIKIYNSYLLWKLIRGAKLTAEDEVQLSGILDFEKESDCLWNSIVRTNYMTVEGDLTEYLQSCRMDEVSFSVKEFDGKNCFLVIWNVRNGSREILEEQLEAIIKTNTDIRKIVCSRPYREFGRAAEALAEAWTADEYYKDRDGVLWFDGMEHWMTLDAGNRELMTAARNGDFASIRHLAVVALAKRGEEMYRYRYFCAGLLLALNGMREYSIYAEEQPDIMQILRSSDPEFMDGFLKNVITVADRIMAGQNAKQDRPLIEKMKLYLAERYGDPNFSFQEMAEEYNMSLPALSKYFREKTGMVINDYVTELKMNRAKYLLVNTDMAAADIALEVGYYNAASFSRRFRQIMDCSPSEYRKKMGKRES